MLTLEFTLHPADLPRLAQWPGMRAGRSFPTTITWHDTEDGALASTGSCLATVNRQWRLAGLHPETAITVPPSLAQARNPSALPNGLPTGLAPRGRFVGLRRTLQWPDPDGVVTLHTLHGRLDTPPPQRRRAAACRVTLTGAAAALHPLAVALAHDIAIEVPRWGMAEQAIAAERGEVPPPRALGAPIVAEDLPVTDSLAAIAGHLLDVMLHWAHQIADAHSPEPVHQMRVATRRLRSALTIYKPATCPELRGLAVALKLCASRLGIARDWDVFIGGLGARLAEAFPEDPRCTAMLRATHRRRRLAYAELRAFLAGPDFRTLTVALACAATLRPWEATAPPEGLQQHTAQFAATVLARRMKRVRKAGRHIDTLTIPALHELRKDCKRLRYAAEFFASLFPAKKTKRFLSGLADLQEELGLLNDSAAVSGLMAQLGRLERSYAAGLVEGFSAAHAGTARGRISLAWKRFKAAQPFW